MVLNRLMPFSLKFRRYAINRANRSFSGTVINAYLNVTTKDFTYLEVSRMAW